MNEYKVVLIRGWFDRETKYITANSAQEIQETIEKRFGYEIENEGLRLEISKL